MKTPILFVCAFLMLLPPVLGQNETEEFEQDYIRKNLIRKVKTTYEYYEADRKGKKKKKNRRIGKVIYSYNDDGRIVAAEYYLADGSYSNKDEYAYDSEGTITGVKKSRVIGNYAISKTERVYSYELFYDNGALSYSDLTIYDVQNGKKGQEQRKKLKEINVYYPSCFDNTKLGDYIRDKDGLIKSIAIDEEHEQVFEYEFF